jgi:hypothetical protein
VLEKLGVRDAVGVGEGQLGDPFCARPGHRHRHQHAVIVEGRERRATEPVNPLEAHVIAVEIDLGAHAPKLEHRRDPV